jgi:uncharacterized Tic20 family protein
MAAEPAGSGEDRNLAMLAHILGIVTGWLGPLIIYLVAGPDKPFAKKQGAEALNFQITVLIAYIASWVLMFVMIGFVLFPVVWIVSLIFSIMAAVAVNKGEDYRYPIALRLIK